MSDKVKPPAVVMPARTETRMVIRLRVLEWIDAQSFKKGEKARWKDMRPCSNKVPAAVAIA